MKSFLPALMLMLLTSCTKETLTTPKSVNQSTRVNTAVSYKDNSISIVDFKARQDNKTIDITFTTLYVKNIVALEVLRGLTETNLCSIYKQEVSTNTDSAIRYNASDQNDNKANAIFYMVKYTLANGDWGYTPVYKLTL